MAILSDDEKRIAADTEKRLGLPAGLLVSTLAEGLDVSPEARREALENFGIDAKISKRNAIEVAGVTMMSALERNRGDEGLALAEYRFGRERGAWGKDAERYVQRVSSRRSASGVNAAPPPPVEMAGGRRSARGLRGEVEPMPQPAAAPSSLPPPPPAGEAIEPIDDVIASAQRTLAAPAPAAAPAAPAPAVAMAAQSQAPPAGEREIAGPMPAGPKTLAAYADGTMSPEKRQRFEYLVKTGSLTVPAGFQVGSTETPSAGSRIVEGVKEAVTGAKRTTAEVEAAGDYTMMPEFQALIRPVGDPVAGEGMAATLGRTALRSVPLAEVAINAARSAGPLTVGSGEELAQMMRANNPDMPIRQDEKGNYLFTSSDGREYAFKPGFRASDIPRLAANAAIMAPAGAVPGIAKAAGAAAATQAGLEFAQAARGGSVDPREVALAGALGGAVPAAARVAQGVKAAAQTLRRGAPAVAQQAATEAAEDVTQTATRTIPTATRTAPMVADDATQTATRTVPDLGDAAPPPPPPRGPPPPMAGAAEPPTPPGAPPGAEARPSDAEMAELLVRAARGDIRSRERLAGMAQVNADDLEAFKAIGIENTPIDIVSDNPQMRALAGLVRGKVGTAAEAEMGGFVGEALRKADDVIAAFDAQLVDGVPAPGVTSDRVLTALKEQQATLKSQTDDLYRQIDKAVPRTTEMRLDNLRSLLRDIRREVGDDRLTAAERNLVRLADDPGATYGALMRAKNEIGAALSRQASPFADVDQAVLKRLYGALAQDQVDNVGRVGGDQMRQALRRANVLTGTKKRLEERMTAAFGRDLEGSIGPLLQRSIKEAAGGAGDRKAFEKVMALVPPELQREAVATALAANFRKAIGGGGSVFDLAGFASKYDALRANPAVYGKIVKALGGDDADALLRALYTVSKRVTAARGAVKTTGKANQEAFEQALAASGGLVEGIMGSAIGRSIVTGAAAAKLGPLGAGATSMIGDALAKSRSAATSAAADLFTSPDFRELALKLGTGAAPTPSDVRRTAASEAFRAFAKAARLPRDQVGRERYLSTLIQAVRQTRPRGDDR